MYKRNEMSNFTISWLQKEVAGRLVNTFQSKIQKEFVNPLTKKFVEEYMTNVTSHKHTRPFNLKHAKAGAPVGIVSGKPVRILTYDRKSIYKEAGVENTKEIIALVENGEYENVRIFDLNTGEGIWGCHEKLVMIPFSILFGKPVFVGDEIEFYSRSYWYKKTITSGDTPFLKNQHIRFRWPEPEYIMYKGSRLTLESEIWWNPTISGEAVWKKIRVKDRFSDMEEVRKKLVKCFNIYHMHYEWKPTKFNLHGKVGDKMSVLWFRVDDTLWVKVDANSLCKELTHFERLCSDIQCHQFYSWEDPRKPVLKEVWQAVFENGKGKRYGDMIYSSASECEAIHSKAKGFLYVEQTNGYWG